MGDPVGDPAAAPDLIWRLRELADQAGGIRHRRRADLRRLERLLDLAVVLKQAQVGPDLVARMRGARERMDDAVILFSRVGLAGDGLPAGETGARREGAIEVLDLARVAAEEEEEGAPAFRWRLWLRETGGPRRRPGPPPDPSGDRWPTAPRAFRRWSAAPAGSAYTRGWAGLDARERSRGAGARTAVSLRSTSRSASRIWMRSALSVT